MTAAATSSWTQPRQSWGPQKQPETQDRSDWDTYELFLDSVYSAFCFCRPATHPCWPLVGWRVSGRVCRSYKHLIGSLLGYWWAAAWPSGGIRRRKGLNTQTAPGAQCILQISPVTKGAVSLTVLPNSSLNMILYIILVIISILHMVYILGLCLFGLSCLMFCVF